MSWWKKIFNAIPVLFAGYEVGKSIEEKDTKQILETIREKTNNIQIDENNTLNNIEILLLATSILVIIIYLIKMIKKMISKSVQVQVQEQQRI